MLKEALGSPGLKREIKTRLVEFDISDKPIHFIIDCNRSDISSSWQLGILYFCAVESRPSNHAVGGVVLQPDDQPENTRKELKRKFKQIVLYKT